MVKSLCIDFKKKHDRWCEEKWCESNGSVQVNTFEWSIVFYIPTLNLFISSINLPFLANSEVPTLSYPFSIPIHHSLLLNYVDLSKQEKNTKSKYLQTCWRQGDKKKMYLSGYIAVITLEAETLGFPKVITRHRKTNVFILHCYLLLLQLLIFWYGIYIYPYIYTRAIRRNRREFGVLVVKIYQMVCIRKA